jgi:glycosyltransferase involved in cell wall biosynthesis
LTSCRVRLLARSSSVPVHEMLRHFGQDFLHAGETDSASHDGQTEQNPRRVRSDGRGRGQGSIGPAERTRQIRANHLRSERPESIRIEAVKGGQSGALAEGVMQEGLRAPGVEMLRSQRSVEYSLAAVVSQPISEVTIGVVRAIEGGSEEAHLKTALSAQGHVSHPEGFENRRGVSVQSLTMAVVGAGVDPAGHRPLRMGDAVHRHVPDHDQIPAVSGMPLRMPGGQRRHRKDVVVEEQHDVTSGDGHGTLEGEHLPSPIDLEVDKPLVLPAESGQDFGRSDIVGAVDGNHQLQGARIGENRPDQRLEEMGPVAGGDDHRDGGKGSSRHEVVFVSWGAVGGRPAELADAIGADFICLYPMGAGRRPPVLVRYLVSAVLTGRYLRRHRPRTVVVTNPPIVAALVTYGWARAIGARVVLDSHPGGFGAQGDRTAARLQRFHRWLVRRTALSLVATSEWGDIVRSWGGEAEVVHEAPGSWSTAPPHRHDPLRLLFVGRFAPDEPFEHVVQAAALVPSCEILLTGDPKRCPESVVQDAPPNVRFIGFLDSEDYQGAVADADVVICLTTEPGSVMRAAYEAVYARRPLIISGWPIAHDLFPFAVHVDNGTTQLADAIRIADARFDELASRTEAARELQLDRFNAQRLMLMERVAGRT